MEDRIDAILYENLKDNINIPKKLPEMIIKTINENCYCKEKKNKANTKKHTLFYKLATTMCACILLTSTVVLAKEIIELIFKIPKEYGQESLEKAIEENYIQANESGEYIKDKNGTLYKFNHVLLNDINLILSLEFVFEENVEEYQDIAINGLEIKDENNNQIYFSSEDQDIWLKNIATNMINNISEKDKNKVKETILLVGNNFPKSKMLYISFDSIVIYNVNNGVLEEKRIEGKYNIEISIDEKFEDRDILEYQVIRSNNKKIEIESVKVTNTGLGITFNGPILECTGYNIKIYDTNDNEIYSKQNDIGNFENLNKYFAWLDVDYVFKENNNFKIIITDLDNNELIYEVEKKY